VVWYTWLSRDESGSAFNWSGLRRVRGDRLRTARSLGVYRAAARRLER